MPTNPSFIYDFFKPSYEYVAKTTGKKHPTLAIYGNDIQAGKSAVQNDSVSAQGAGFKVTGRLATIPIASEVSDYTPYVEQLLKSGENGQPPDSIDCVMAVQCLNVNALMTQHGYKGISLHALYTDSLVKPFVRDRSGHPLREPQRRRHPSGEAVPGRPRRLPGRRV